jgi:hypothetical protein
LPSGKLLISEYIKWHNLRIEAIQSKGNESRAKTADDFKVAHIRGRIIEENH